MQPPFLIVGLGNPGEEYEGTRHNIGFLALDGLAARGKAGPWQRKFKGLTASGKTGEAPCLFLKPMTFMNLSGESVAEAVRFYKIPLDHLYVLHDDMDLGPGQIKVKQGGGAGGHNGLKSIDAHLGPDYWRVRLGIGHPVQREQVTNYVLSRFAKADKVWCDPLLESVSENFSLLLDGAVSKFVEKVKRAVG